MQPSGPIHQIGLSYWPARLRIDSWAPEKVYIKRLRITTLVRRKLNSNSCNFPERCFFKSTDNCRRCTSLWIVSALKRRSEIPGNEELPEDKRYNFILHYWVAEIIECTQSGNGHFLAYIPIWGKNKPRSGEGGWRTHTPFHYIYHHVQRCGVRSIWKGRYTPPISNPPLYVPCGWDFGQVRQAEYVNEICPSG